MLVVLPLLAPAPAQGCQEDGGRHPGRRRLHLQPGLSTARLRCAPLRNMGATHLRLNILWWQAVPTSQRNQTYGALEHHLQLRRLGHGDRRVRAPTASSHSSTSPATRRRIACGSKEVPYECDGLQAQRQAVEALRERGGLPLQGHGDPLLALERAELVHVAQPAQQGAAPLPQALQDGYKASQGATTRAPRSSLGELAPHFQPNISTPPLQFIREMVCVNKKLKPITRRERKCKGKLKFDAFVDASVRLRAQAEVQAGQQGRGDDREHRRACRSCSTSSARRA